MTTTKPDQATQQIQALHNGIQAFHWSDGKVDLVYQQHPIGSIHHLGDYDLRFQGVYRLVDGDGDELARGTQAHCIDAIWNDALLPYMMSGALAGNTTLPNNSVG